MSTLEGDALHEYLCREVKNICDAEPDLVARYISALISSGDSPAKLRQILEEKLREFFDDQTVPFINRLFKELGYDSAATREGRAEEHHSRRRLSDYSDEEDDSDRNFKHRRPRYSSREDSRHMRHSDDRYSRRRYGDNNNGYGNNNNRYREEGYRNNRDDHHHYSSSSMYQSRHDNRERGRSSRREIGRSGKPLCRDYNEKGFCMRGDMCPYDHGDDRIVVDDGSFNTPFPPMSQQQPAPAAAPPFFGMPNTFDPYDPESATLMPNGSFPMDMPPMMAPMDNVDNRMFATPRGRGRGLGGRGRGRGRGGMGGGYRPFGERQQPSTLVVENIPAEHCDISKVNEFFKKFGSITNISVQGHAHKAIIQFSTNAEAKAAYNSPDAIFDNRFVKVYWHKENDEDSKPPKQMSPAPTTTSAPTSVSAPDVPATASSSSSSASAAAATATGAPAPSTTPSTSTLGDNSHELNPSVKRPNDPDPEEVAARAAELAKIREEKQKKHQERMKAILEVQRQREQLLQKQIAEQKRLMEKLSNKNMTHEEKKELLGALRKIATDIDSTRSKASEDNQNTSTEDLQAKLAKVEAEAAALGIPVHGSSAPTTSGPGAYYGGGGKWPNRSRYTLDNRPKKILVKDVPEDAKDDLRTHFNQFGTITTFETQGSDLIVQYAQRFEAEKAMTAGAKSSHGDLKLSWATNAPSQPAPPATASPTTSTSNEA
ncbi:hypothetical protein O0I10_005434 [Lichtheimia ornata]|uniref:C3H1-type domain-containing protein n=1 Tax=Lichtheimia ornata TaxID=688661 RepID=A0AAD7V550_9FUNG|nr:uncharacterized protein O0I10_005434 [Lichtheimia ornata]KAJ8658711.1 hypothetical protein O0I10_005434 [Lichtheimia ornata]